MKAENCNQAMSKLTQAVEANTKAIEENGKKLKEKTSEEEKEENWKKSTDWKSDYPWHENSSNNPQIQCTDSTGKTNTHYGSNRNMSGRNWNASPWSKNYSGRSCKFSGETPSRNQFCDFRTNGLNHTVSQGSQTQNNTTAS